MKHTQIGAMLALSLLGGASASQAESLFTYTSGKLQLTGGVGIMPISA